MPLSIKKDINTSLILPYFKLFVENFLTMPTHINIVSEIDTLNQNNVNYLNEITSKKSSSDKTHLIYWEENNGLHFIDSQQLHLKNYSIIIKAYQMNLFNI